MIGINNVSASVVCTKLDNILSYGTNGSEVYSLQKYLNEVGYLKPVANGHFGVGTRDALKKFQKDNGITMTGQTGPITRSMIQKLSCAQDPKVTQQVVDTKSTMKQNIDYSSFSSIVGSDAVGTVSSPLASSSQTIGNKLTLVWNNISGSVYDILLFDNSGNSVGYISSNVSGGTFEWNVGHIFTSTNRDDQTISPGIYRIVLRPSYSLGSKVPVQYSSLFTVLGKPISLGTLIPGVVSNGGKSSIAISGSGLDSSSVLYFGPYENNYKSSQTFVTKDGSLAVFSVPTYIPAGNYNVFVLNAYSSGATSTPSNTLNVTVQN
jgi:peptidoglycan hydrolase-like protein with peptidoglycan-binding domain